MKKIAALFAAALLGQIAQASDMVRYTVTFEDSSSKPHKISILTSVGRAGEAQVETYMPAVLANAEEGGSKEIIQHDRVIDRVSISVEPQETDSNGHILTSIKYGIESRGEHADGSVTANLASGGSIDLSSVGGPSRLTLNK